MNFGLAGLIEMDSLLVFKPLNRFAEPLPEGCFQFVAGPKAIKEINGFALFIQRNVAARNFVVLMSGWDHLHQDAIAARFRWLSRIKIQASW